MANYFSNVQTHYYPELMTTQVTLFSDAAVAQVKVC